MTEQQIKERARELLNAPPPPVHDEPEHTRAALALADEIQAAGEDERTARLLAFEAIADELARRYVALMGDDLEPGAFECQNCAAAWHLEDLRDIRRYWERVDPGEPEPAGECPDCGSLCHESPCPEPYSTPRAKPPSDSEKRGRSTEFSRIQKIASHP
jgi:hypothetical protein